MPVKSMSKTKAKARAQALALAQKKAKRKRILILSSIGLGFVIFLIVFLTRSEEGPVKQAESFLVFLSEGKMGEAYQRTARTFQNRVTSEAFQAHIEELGLHHYASVFWARKNIMKEQADLEGTVTTKTQEKIPLNLTLTFVEGEWKIYALGSMTGGITLAAPEQPQQPAAAAEPPLAPPDATPAVQTPGIPSGEALKRLVFDSMLSLQEAVRKNDFNQFYGSITQRWQKETNVAELKKKYQELADKKFDKTLFVGLQPVFDRDPNQNLDESFTVVGSYPTKPLKVSFELKYAYENTAWRLREAEIKLTGGPGPVQLPGSAELDRLVSATLLDFNAAIVQKDFNAFYRNITKQWQKQTTPEKLQAIFQSYIDSKIDIQGMTDLEPVYTEKPVLNMDNQFSVSGYYEGKDLRVEFKISYQFEDAKWKPFSISPGVRISRPAEPEQKAAEPAKTGSESK